MTKLTAAGVRELKSMGNTAQKAVQSMLDWMGAKTSGRNLDFRASICLDEGARYTFVAPDGRVNAVSMVSESTLGAMKTHGGLNYQVGKQFPIPVGAFVVENRLFLGQKFSTIYHNNGQEKLAAG